MLHLKELLNSYGRSVDVEKFQAAVQYRSWWKHINERRHERKWAVGVIEDFYIRVLARRRIKHCVRIIEDFWLRVLESRRQRLFWLDFAVRILQKNMRTYVFKRRLARRIQERREREQYEISRRSQNMNMYHSDWMQVRDQYQSLSLGESEDESDDLDGLPQLEHDSPMGYNRPVLAIEPSQQENPVVVYAQRVLKPLPPSPSSDPPPPTDPQVESLNATYTTLLNQVHNKRKEPPVVKMTKTIQIQQERKGAPRIGTKRDNAADRAKKDRYTSSRNSSLFMKVHGNTTSSTGKGNNLNKSMSPTITKQKPPVSAIKHRSPVPNHPTYVQPQTQPLPQHVYAPSQLPSYRTQYYDEDFERYQSYLQEEEDYEDEQYVPQHQFRGYVPSQPPPPPTHQQYQYYPDSYQIPPQHQQQYSPYPSQPPMYQMPQQSIPTQTRQVIPPQPPSHYHPQQRSVPPKQSPSHHYYPPTQQQQISKPRRPMQPEKKLANLKKKITRTDILDAWERQVDKFVDTYFDSSQQ